MLILEDSFTNPEHRQYAYILKHYLMGSQNDLKAYLRDIAPDSFNYIVGQLRLQNLMNEWNEEQIQVVKKLVTSDTNRSGETAFALGMTYLRFKKNEDAKSIFHFAHQNLKALGAPKKAVKALLNVVVAESRIDNKRMLIGDYNLVAREAKKVNDPIVEGICYQNISKELHLLGALRSALNYSNKALELQQSDMGNLHYFETLLHRCHVLIELGRFSEAHLDFELAKTSSHSEISEALKCIETLLGDPQILKLDHLEPAWRSKLKRQKEQSSSPVFTAAEMRFLEILIQKPVSRNDIISILYGDYIDWESGKNRFKVFLNRFRKKHPHIIAEEDGYLILVDQSILTPFNIA